VLAPSGLHHVTAIASDPQRNLDFYAGVLGLRLVKRTVNFDDPTTYHFYFGDDVGHPGTLLTFFPWPDARRGRQGAGQAQKRHCHMMRLFGLHAEDQRAECLVIQHDHPLAKKARLAAISAAGTRPAASQ
jgi:catechol 2,3-dioxygenase-like lactoylglutathione lyase family enzyme